MQTYKRTMAKFVRDWSPANEDPRRHFIRDLGKLVAEIREIPEQTEFYVGSLVAAGDITPDGQPTYRPAIQMELGRAVLQVDLGKAREISGLIIEAIEQAQMDSDLMKFYRLQMSHDEAGQMMQHFRDFRMRRISEERHEQKLILEKLRKLQDQIDAERPK